MQKVVGPSQNASVRSVEVHTLSIPSHEISVDQ